MSAKKSWDIQSRPKQAVRVERKAPPREEVVGPDIVRNPVRNRAVPRGRLADRRKSARKARAIALAVIISVLGVLGVVALWQSPLRISQVKVQGAEDLEEQVRQSLVGTYAFIVPRNSALFYPEEAIREQLLTAHPEFAAVSVGLSSFSALSIVVTQRVPALVWCGEIYSPDAPCYAVDPEGLIFAPYTPTDVALPRFYAPLAEGTSVEEPIRARLRDSWALMDLLKYKRAIEGMGIDVAYATISGDELELHATSGTKLRSVVGKEVEAAATAASALPTLDIASGTYEYVDLRFPGRAYAKRVGQ